VWLAPMAQDKRVRLSVGGEGLTVMGDAEQLREAVNNVVANAILYNRAEGSVTISTRMAGRMAQIEIVDTGIGIPQDAVPRVFERFFRVDKARSRDVGGSGLGLAIARTIVVAHGGDISCTSEPGVGSAFVLSLPATAASRPATAAPSRSALDN
jgi:signal transduction histidine kinase